MSSPRPWGCFYWESIGGTWGGVFPTPVGVFLSVIFSELRFQSLPHARGGVSEGAMDHPMGDMSSPRPWGCFSPEEIGVQGAIVFPTPVGVFLILLCMPWLLTCLPHARGGVSSYRRNQRCLPRSSPRPWGCFHYSTICQAFSVVFPTPVGVFLKEIFNNGLFRSLPHARGGVSLRSAASHSLYRSSPRPWGCFYPRAQLTHPGQVFPTPVGVFLSRTSVSHM